MAKTQGLSWVEALSETLKTTSLDDMAAEGWMYERDIAQSLAVAGTTVRDLLRKRVFSGEFESTRQRVLCGGCHRTLTFYRPVKWKPCLTRKKK